MHKCVYWTAFNRMILDGTLINLTAKEPLLQISSGVEGQKVLSFMWKDDSHKAFIFKQWIKTLSWLSVFLFCYRKKNSFWHSHATRLYSVVQVQDMHFLRFPPHKRAHRENSYSPPVHRLENTLWIISHNLKSHRLNRNLGMALILTVNSNHPPLQGLIADSLHLSLWMLFSIHGIAPMAGCLQFAIWLCVFI